MLQCSQMEVAVPGGCFRPTTRTRPSNIEVLLHWASQQQRKAFSAWADALQRPATATATGRLLPEEAERFAKVEDSDWRLWVMRQRLRSFVLHWRGQASKGHVLREASLALAGRRRRREAHRAIAEWSQYCEEAILSRVLVFRAETFLRFRLLTRILENWQVLLLLKAKKQAKAREAKNVIRRVRLPRALKHWKAWAAEKYRVKASTQAVMLGVRRRLQFTALQAWQEYLLQRHSKKARQMLAMEAFRVAARREALQALQEAQRQSEVKRRQLAFRRCEEEAAKVASLLPLLRRWHSFLRLLDEGGLAQRPNLLHFAQPSLRFALFEDV
mmetsp:Transcript_16792/g.36105  ORF Transcript_16792/g.36105 Transcript_16792/m.36105 type:complete len:329 (+) Transcript_16792:246-1232(+)